jgi:cytochrome c553
MNRNVPANPDRTGLAASAARIGRGLACALTLVLATTVCAQDARPVDDTVGRAVHVCAACHGEFGRSTDKRYPPLAGQMSQYTIRQLKDFRSQSRAETDIQAYMWGISALLTDETIVGLARYYEEQSPRPPKSVNPKLEAAGKRLFETGMPDKEVKACADCHGDAAEGYAGFPRLAGLQATYVVRQLQAFRTPLRKHGVVMKKEIRSLTDAEMRAVGAYLASR